MRNKEAIASPAAITKVAWRFAKEDFTKAKKGEGTPTRMGINRGLIVSFHKKTKTRLKFRDIEHLLTLDKLPEKYTRNYDASMHYSAANPVLSISQAEELLVQED